MEESYTLKQWMLTLCTVLISLSHLLISAQGAAPAVTEPPVMRQMWMTPIQTSSVLEQLNDIDIPSLQALAFDYYSDFRTAQNMNHAFLDKDATLSDSFFQFQKTDTNRCRQLTPAAAGMISECVASLPVRLQEIGQKIFLPAIRKFLSEIYVNTDNIPSSSTSFAWVSVHGNGSSHPLHHHKTSLVSAVLYLSVPKGSGDIVFHDPRGSLPPFGKNHFIMQPVSLLK